MNGARIDSRISWVVAHMQRHLAEPMSVHSLASLVNLSPSRFRALFTAQTGLGPAQYLQWLRYRRARLLLERTFLSVKEVMVLVGYTDPSHFSRDFRRHHGASPTTFRARELTSTLTVAGGPSVDPPTIKRNGQPRARDPGLRCA